MFLELGIVENNLKEGYEWMLQAASNTHTSMKFICRQVFEMMFRVAFITYFLNATLDNICGI